MSGTFELLFLGTGTSHGIPMIGCDCAVCRSQDPRDRRNRTSAALRLPDGQTILIDVSPEFRLAAIAFGLARVDAVLLTHAHADHIMGMDDLRRYNNIRRDVIPVFGDALTIERTRNCFGYADRPYLDPNRPSLAFTPIHGPTEVCGLSVTPVPLRHGRGRVLGFRIGGLAYCTDCSEIPDETWPLLEGVDLLVLDALRYTPHPAHFNVEQALAVIARAKPGRALLTHIAHEIAHEPASAKLPATVEFATDGLRVTVPL